LYLFWKHVLWRFLFAFFVKECAVSLLPTQSVECHFCNCILPHIFKIYSYIWFIICVQEINILAKTEELYVFFFSLCRTTFLYKACLQVFILARFQTWHWAFLFLTSVNWFLVSDKKIRKKKLFYVQVNLISST